MKYRVQSSLSVTSSRFNDDNWGTKHTVVSVFIPNAEQVAVASAQCLSVSESRPLNQSIPWYIYSAFCLQILEVNGQNFENVQLNKANEILKNNTHLSITVKTNLLGKYLAMKS